MNFVPFPELNGRPSIIVDGSAAPGTIQVLSHWPKSGTPGPLKADTSAEIAMRYLERPEFHVDAVAVSNNHFDEDGLVGLFALLNPERALARRERYIDAASAGDFGVYRSRDAARAAFAISAFADPERSPLGAAFFRRPYPAVAADLYRELLPRLGEIVERVDRYRDLWSTDDGLLEASERDIRSGAVRIEETPDLDLAVVTLPAGGACHAMALHGATSRFRILQTQGRRHRLQVRYEGWVQVQSVRPLARVDLAPLAKRLSAEEGSRWTFDGVDALTPALQLEGGGESRIAPDRFVAQVKSFLADAPAAWNPYDPS